MHVIVSSSSFSSLILTVRCSSNIVVMEISCAFSSLAVYMAMPLPLFPGMFFVKMS